MKEIENLREDYDGSPYWIMIRRIGQHAIIENAWLYGLDYDDKRGSETRMEAAASIRNARIALRDEVERLRRSA